MTQQKISKALNLIKKSFVKRQKEQPKFSLRKLASLTGVSSGYLSKVLSGQKALTPELAVAVCKHLQMDQLQQEAIFSAMKSSVTERFTHARKKHGVANDEKRLQHGEILNSESLSDFELAPRDCEWILSRWYYIAILDLTTAVGFQESPEWIARRLQISATQATEGLKALMRAELLVRDENGALRKKYEKLRFPTTLSKDIIRKFHSSQLKRALQVLDLPVSQKEFEARLLTGLTVATNLENLERAKAYIHNALYEAARILTEGPCTELYQLNLQVFPQTRPAK